jgi:chemotaxis protein MotB
MRTRSVAALVAGTLLATGCVTKGDLNAKSRELDAATAAYNQERQKSAELGERVSGLERQLADTTAELGKARGDAARLAQQLQDTTRERDSVARQLALAQEAAGRTGSDLTQLTARYDGIVKDLEREKSELGQRAAELVGRLAEAESRVTALAAERAAAETALAAARGELTTARGELASLRSELDATRRNLGETQEQLAERERRLAEATATYDQLVGDLKKEIADGEVKITRLRDKLTVNLVDKVLFDSGSIAIKPRGREVLLKVASVLKGVSDKRIQIEGHTDNVRITGSLKARFPSNWELSTSRATVVARFLQEHGQVDPARLVAAGYGQYRPVASNDSADGRAENRRIEIVLLPVGTEAL